MSLALQNLAASLQTTRLGSLFQMLADASAMAQPALSQVGALLMSVLTPALQILAPLIEAARANLANLGVGLQQVFSGDLLGGLQTILAGYLGVAGTVAQTWAGLAQLVITKGLEFAAAMATWVWNALPGFVSGLLGIHASLGTWISGSPGR
jgi:hypothetical protein